MEIRVETGEGSGVETLDARRADAAGGSDDEGYGGDEDEADDEARVMMTSAMRMTVKTRRRHMGRSWRSEWRSWRRSSSNQME
jgi:hypothetical protein